MNSLAVDTSCDSFDEPGVRRRAALLLLHLRGRSCFHLSVVQRLDPRATEGSTPAGSAGTDRSIDLPSDRTAVQLDQAAFGLHRVGSDALPDILFVIGVCTVALVRVLAFLVPVILFY